MKKEQHKWKAELAELLDENKPTRIRDFISNLLSQQKEELLQNIAEYSNLSAEQTKGLIKYLLNNN